MSQTGMGAMSDLSEAGAALSPQQKRLWRLSQSSPAYRVCGVVEIEGTLDCARLERAVQQVADAHAILRMRFARQPGNRMPVQTPGECNAWSEVLDLSSLSPDEQEACCDRIRAAQTQDASDLEGRPALKLQLVRLGAMQSRLLLSLNPLCGDSHTPGLLMRAIASAYAARPEADIPSCEGLPYIQFAAWQNELLETPDAILDEATAYWSSRPLHSPADNLPIRCQTAESRPFAPDCVSLTIKADLREAIASEAGRGDVSEAELLFACWCAFLWRWTENRSGAIGYLSNGRPFEELGEVMGLLARALPITLDAEQSVSFRAFAAGIQANLQEALEWQDYFLFAPAPAQDSATPESLTLAFEYDERVAPQTESGLIWTLRHQEAVIEPFQLKLGCIREDDALRAELVFDSAVYERVTVERLLQGWLELVGDAIQRPEERIDRLRMLGAEERALLVSELNDTASPFPHSVCFHDLFQEQAARTPDRIAVRCGANALTYGELDERSSRLAGHLEDLGVGPETYAGICLSRSPYLLVAILAVLKAGAAYVPLDASQPAERLSHIIDDAAPVVILSETGLEDSLPNSYAFLICLDTFDFSAGTAKGNSSRTVGPDNLAYIIYTSGSTGRPKGVMVPHRGLVNYTYWSSAAYDMSAGCSTLVDSPVGFDLTVTGLLSPLVVGQTVTLVPEADGLEALAGAFQQESDITCIKTTPAQLEVLRNLLPPHKAASARRLVIGGENLHWSSLSFWKQNAPAAILVNEYGPTETVVGSTFYEAAEDSGASESVPIGQPIANTTVYLLDPYLQLVPMGANGELYIGGTGVTRGYLGRPDLTAERYLPDPFGSHPGARLYKTGDVCRYLPDGNLEYLGRTDHQVKIRGYRIELGEIESLLLGQPNVREALVLAREDEPGDKRLVAYLVGAEDTLDASALRERLREKLPEYMVPSAFVLLASLPLTPNGKVDRPALPAPEAGGEGGREYVAPRTPMEEEVAEIWSEALRQERVGLHANFFDLGGHSLLATQVFSRIRNLYQVELPLRTIFESPTLAEFTAKITAARGEMLVETPVLTRASREAALPLSFAQQRLWLIDQLEPDGEMFNVPLAFRLTGTLDLQALQDSLNEIVRRHEALRTVYPAIDVNPRQVVSPNAALPMPLVDLSDRPESERDRAVRQLITESAHTRFDLARGPLFRAQLLRLAPEDHVLLLVTHHIGWDGASNGILLREWSALYNAFREGRPSPLPELPFQYADFAAWQREWVRGRVSEAQLAYWRSQLNGADYGLPVHTDRAEAAEPNFESAAQYFACPAEVAGRLKELAQAEKASLYMALLAVFNVLLYQDAHQEDICVGTPVSGRRWTETESMIGLFLNTLVMRADLSGNPSFRTLVQRVRQTVLAAHANQDLPFEQVVDALKPRRDLSHTPLFRLWFVVNDGAPKAAEFSGLTVQGVGSGLPLAKFALWMSFTQIPDGLRGSIIYQTGLFDAATVERMVRKTERLLAIVAEDPDLPLARIADQMGEMDRQAREEQELLLDEANRLRIGRVARTAIRR